MLQNCSKSLEKASIYLEIFLKSLKFFEKKPNITSKKLQSIEMASKSLVVFIKTPRFCIEATISLEMSSKSLVMFIKSS
jgi:hypothetical protein